MPFDPEDPPIEPPPSVQQPLLWSVSRRVYGDHDAPDGQGGPMVPQCRLCGEPWPCRARRVAEHGLLAACRAPIDSAGPASYLDRFLADGGPERRRSPTNRGPFEDS